MIARYHNQCLDGMFLCKVDGNLDSIVKSEKIANFGGRIICMAGPVDLSRFNPP